MASRERLFIGMSDGAAGAAVEAALASVRSRRERMKLAELAHVSRPLAPDLCDALRALWSVSPHVPGGPRAVGERLAALDRDVAAAFVEAAEALLRQAGVAGADVTAIGCSGWRAAICPPRGGGAVLELGSPARIAARTGIAAVGGFAAGDLAAGGVGGPVTAWPVWRIFRHRRLSRAIVHLGGLAAIAFVGSDAAPADVVAFETGPGTILVDALARRLPGRPTDADGAAAARGRASPTLLNELLASEHFHRQWPKLACPADWAEPFLPRLDALAAKHDCRGDDLLATAAELTARTVADAVLAQTERPHEVVLCGAGAANIHLAGRIRTLLSPSSTYTSQRYGLSLRGLDAACWAMLAAARVDGFAAHCPSATGAAATVVLGSLAPGASPR